ncbi:MAG: DUF2461 domain-containing protein [Bacteroidales bacterium]|nr:DUF2461 domain-containing protein [Bacteroidales bacterium]
MINTATLNFLSDLERNNNREWFHANQEKYEAAKESVLQTVLYFTAEISKFDNSIKPFDPKKGLFRIARDTRFCKNKDPYKLNFGACINPEGKNISSLSTYYLHVKPNESFFSAGVYMPEKDELTEIRYAIYNNFDEFYSIINAPAFIKKFGKMSTDYKLTRVPMGFDKNDPSAEYLKFKNFFVYINLSDDVLTNPIQCSDAVISAAKLMMPFNNFFNSIFR